jgi:hypothetical protein
MHIIELIAVILNSLLWRHTDNLAHCTGNIENLRKRFSQSQDDNKNIFGQSNRGGIVETLRKRFAQSQTNPTDLNMVVKTGNSHRVKSPIVIIVIIIIIINFYRIIYWTTCAKKRWFITST